MKKSASLSKKKLALEREVVKQLSELRPEQLQHAAGRAGYSVTAPCGSGQWYCPG